MDYETNYLEHHGIKGMRWGIRRFQEENGRLTKEGIERYRENEKKYNLAKSNKENAKLGYKEGTVTKEEYLKTKRKLRSAKIKLSRSYDDVKNANHIDKGKALSDKGVGQVGNAVGHLVANRGIRMITSFASNIVSSNGKPNVLSKAVREAGNAFIAANTLHMATNAYDLAAYKKYKAGGEK